MKYAYIRVSTVDQNEARQLEAMKKHGIPAENYFTEKVSGKNADRPQLKRMLETVQSGDVIYIHDFSRLSRSTADLLRIVEELNKRGVTLISNKENLDTSTPTGKLMLTMIGAINEFERTNMIERVNEGIAACKKAGTYSGGRPCHYDKTLFRQLHAKYLARQITKKDMAQQLGISRPTLDKLLTAGA